MTTCIQGFPNREKIQSQKKKLAGAILRFIKQQRNGETIYQGLVERVIDSFVSLGVDETDINKASLKIYKEHLQLHGRSIARRPRHTDRLIFTRRWYPSSTKTIRTCSSSATWLRA